MKEHIKSAQDVLEELKVNYETGLTDVQVEERLKEYGLNKLREEKKKTMLQSLIFNKLQEDI